MRLSKEEVEIIKSNILKHIKDAKIMLFGSRVDDSKRGGDIDIFIQTDQIVTLKNEIDISADLERNGILRKVDLVVKAPNKKEQSIFETAVLQGVYL